MDTTLIITITTITTTTIKRGRGRVEEVEQECILNIVVSFEDSRTIYLSIPIIYELLCCEISIAYYSHKKS